MALTPEQQAILKSKLLGIMSNKMFMPDNFNWSVVENGINNLSIDEKDRIAKSLIGSSDDVANFIRTKLKEAVILELTPQIDAIITSEFVPIATLYSLIV